MSLDGLGGSPEGLTVLSCLWSQFDLKEAGAAQERKEDDEPWWVGSNSTTKSHLFFHYDIGITIEPDGCRQL